jgi:hypothetical protein
MYFRRSIKRERKEKFFTNLEKKLGVSLKDLAHDYVSIERSENGVSFESKKIVKEEDNSNKVVDENERRKSSKAIQAHATFYVNSAYAKLGWSVNKGDVNGDGLEDLLVGAPGFAGKGCLFVVYGSPNELIAPGEHNLVFFDFKNILNDCIRRKKKVLLERNFSTISHELHSEI